MAWDTFRDYYVFPLSPNWVSDIPVSLYRRLESLQGLGLGHRQTNYDESVIGFKANFLETEKEDIWELFSFFDNHAGRLEGFWIPSYKEDIVVTEAFGAGATSLKITDIEWDLTWRDHRTTGRYLVLRWPDGTQKYVAIEEAVSETEISLNHAIGKACDATTLPHLFVSFLYFARFDQDELMVGYYTPGVATAELSFRVVPLEGPTVTTTSTTTSSSTSSTSSSSTSSSSTMSSTSSSSSTASTTSSSSSTNSTTSTTQ